MRERPAHARASERSTAVPPAVLLGGEVTALSVARSLHAAGIEVHLLSHSRSCARFSRAVSGFVDVGHEDPQAGMLHWLRSATVQGVVLPASDDGVELIARHRAELVACGHRPVEGDDEVLVAMLDKLKTYELATAHGIPAPRVIRVPDEEALERVAAGITFPCVLKPAHSHLFARRGGTGKVILVSSASDLRREVARLAEVGLEMFVTEVIHGDADEYVSYYGYLDENGSSLVHLTKRKLRQYPPGFGTGTYHETTADPEVAEAGQRFLRAVGVRGLGNVEFKRDRRSGRLVLIECNPRFTMIDELIRAAGVDLALLSYNRVLGRPGPEVGAYRVGLHLWDPLTDMRALRDYRRRDELSVLAWARSLAHRQRLPAFRASDPLPALQRTRWMVQELVIEPRRASMRAGGGRSSAVAGGRASRPSRTVRALELAATRTAAPGRRFAARVDIARSYGATALWRRARTRDRHSSSQEHARRCAFYERIWREAAERCGAEVNCLSPGLLELARGSARTRVYQQVVELDGPVTLQLAVDKGFAHRLMEELGVAHPEYLEWGVEELRAAQAFMASVNGPCVVKPAGGAGGSGVVPGVETAEDLIRARWHAGWETDRLLIERQAEGIVYRLLLLDGELLDIVRKSPPRLTGDGQATIAGLIAQENERRVCAGGAAGLPLLQVTLDTLLTLGRAGMTLASVPPAGRRVALAVATNRNAPGDNETWRGEVAPTILEDARRLAAAIGLRLAGLDVITTDITKPLVETSGVVTEVNGTPGLHHHYLVADPAKATAAAVPVLERLLDGGS